MDISEQKQRVSNATVLLFAGEICTVIALIFKCFERLVAGFTWVSFLGLAGAIIGIVGIYKARQINNRLNNAFVILVINLVVIIVNLILMCIANGVKNPDFTNAYVYIGAGLLIVSLACEILTTIFVIEGVTDFNNTLGINNGNISTISIWCFAIAIIVSLVFSILRLIPSIGNNQTAVITFAILNAVFYTIAYVSYVVFLWISHKAIDAHGSNDVA